MCQLTFLMFSLWITLSTPLSVNLIGCSLRHKCPRPSFYCGEYFVSIIPHAEYTLTKTFNLQSFIDTLVSHQSNPSAAPTHTISTPLLASPSARKYWPTAGATPRRTKAPTSSTIYIPIHNGSSQSWYFKQGQISIPVFVLASRGRASQRYQQSTYSNICISIARSPSKHTCATTCFMLRNPRYTNPWTFTL